jgi:hypothetical protein
MLFKSFDNPEDDDFAELNWSERLSQVVVIQPDNVYSGVFTNDEDWYTVRKNGESFSHEPSLKIRNHSPTGFSWGYGGSGPAQLALALLLEETQDAKLAEHFYMDFKWDVIARLSKDEGPPWTLTSTDILSWLRQKVQSSGQITNAGH